MEIKIEKIVSRDVLENIIVTALEGGSNYWYWLSKKTINKVRRAVSSDEEPYFAVAMLKAVLDHDIEVEINDIENIEDVLGVISKAKMQIRLQELSNDNGYNWALEQEIQGNGDAESSDVVFQYITMGEVVFG